MALSPKIFLGIAGVAVLAATGVIVSNGNKAATPTPRPTPAARLMATPAATPVDPAKLPAAYRGDVSMLPSNVATNLLFIEEMLSGPHKSTMEQVTCHCCNKSLAQCYTDTATKAEKACSPLCSVCNHEGKDVIAAAKIGMPVDELRRTLAEKYGSAGGDHGAGDGHDHGAHPM